METRRHNRLTRHTHTHTHTHASNAAIELDVVCNDRVRRTRVCMRACASVVRWRAIEWQCTHIQNWYTLWWQKSWLPWTFEASLGYASRCSRIISSCDDVKILRDVSRINKEAVICNESAFGLSSWPARDATCRPVRYRFVIALFLQELHTQFGVLKALVSSSILL